MTIDPQCVSTFLRRPAIAVVLCLARPAAAQSFTQVPNLVYGTATGAGGQTVNLLLDLYLPLNGTPPVPVVVWIHGGAWLGGSRFPAPSHATNLCARGYA